MDADRTLFPEFRRERVPGRGGDVYLVLHGSGPPVLLLHGYPQTHACWHRVAPMLAGRFTVVCPDLRGYGDSAKPPSEPDHRTYSKRVMADDQVAVMAQLGFERFAVVGHDRGARVAYRLALDHPAQVTRLAVLDIIPTLETFARLDRRLALATYHWLFLAQPEPLPERLIGANPEFFLRHTLRSWAGSADAFAPVALAEYLRCFRDPATIHATCEDYRAGATLDVADDAVDRARGGRITCPVLALWGGRGVDDRLWDPLAIWREWADDVTGGPVAAGHFLPEEAPDATASALLAFLAAS
jgi:haloacetate dehalogenase